MSRSRPDLAVLFDLDGTLVDSAPDLIGALSALANEHKLGLRAPEDVLARHAGQGARVLIRHGLGEFPSEREEALLSAFLDLYAGAIWQRSQLYPGMLELLDALAGQGTPLAVVTNKSERLARQLLAEAGLLERFGCLVGGDSTPAAKPDPAPVLAACRALGIDPERAVMVGDSEADMLAAHNAGCRGVAVRWGYAADLAMDNWPADAVIDHPDALMSWLEEF